MPEIDKFDPVSEANKIAKLADNALYSPADEHSDERKLISELRNLNADQLSKTYVELRNKNALDSIKNNADKIPTIELNFNPRSKELDAVRISRSDEKSGIIHWAGMAFTKFGDVQGGKGELRKTDTLADTLTGRAAQYFSFDMSDTDKSFTNAKADYERRVQEADKNLSEATLTRIKELADKQAEQIYSGSFGGVPGMCALEDAFNEALRSDGGSGAGLRRMFQELNKSLANKDWTGKTRVELLSPNTLVWSLNLIKDGKQTDHMSYIPGSKPIE